jgi:hypothetical protein
MQCKISVTYAQANNAAEWMATPILCNLRRGAKLMIALTARVLGRVSRSEAERRRLKLAHRRQLSAFRISVT